jgi:hypothetical protein
MLGKALAFGVADSGIRMQRRMARFIGDVVKQPDEIGQQLDIARAVMETAGKAELPRPVPGHFAHGNHDIPGAIPGTAFASVEAVSTDPCIGEGGIHMAVAIEAQIAAAALPG